MTTAERPKAALDLTDREVRAMAERHHVPDEMWSVGGSLLSVHCSTCSQSWPCSTVVRLRNEPEPF